MNRSSFALFVALLIHILFLFLFWFLGSITPNIEKKPQEKRIKISLKTLPKQKQKQKTKSILEVKQQQKVIQKAPPMPKGSQLKKLIKKPSIKFKPKQKTKIKPKKPIKKHKIKAKKSKQQIKTKPIIPKKSYIPLTKKSKKIIYKTKETDPLSWMHEDKSYKNKQQKAKGMSTNLGTKNLKKLYGDKWGKLTPGQQKYMLDNQEIMRRITQEVLNRQARVSDINELNVNKSNIIEFKLHPNGDMSDFRFLSKSGYYILDDLTKATISYAYSKYPRPDETILIRYNVFYNLARY